ncbi:protein PTHB1 isoform X3 [Cylas formicarius]|uniref:protein PTHB1 isoform X3 n=1 Tax=Cylas formicarius TaxID=197179 RepID=UPI002958B761|nr:protein PTHB1 isoform X3 [Cylas formicarius]
MSLFKVRQFWCTNSEDGEYFDQGSMIAAKLRSEFDYIVTGSQSGTLRIFSPNCDLTETGGLGGFRPNDLLIEKLFDEPILQVGCGKVASGTTELHLVVLHSKLLSIYNVVSKNGKNEQGNQCFLQILYEHKLRKSAASMVIGPFGGLQNRDFICVQTLDGLLVFFEQENQGTYVVLPDFLLPGPIVYVKSSDSFVTTNTGWELMSFKYKILSDAADESSDPIYSKPKIASDWSYNLGEAALDIKVVETKNKDVSVLVLGERNLFCMNDSGKLKFMKKFDYCPVAFHVYPLDHVFCLVISETSNLLIYQNATLHWSASLDFMPIALSRACLKNVKGSLVLLSEEGRLECCYLGTEPSFFVAPPLSIKDIDFEKADEELMDLERTIRNSSANDIGLKSNFEKDFQVHVTAGVKSEIGAVGDYNFENVSWDYVCPIYIDIVPQVSHQEVQITVFVCRPLAAIPNCHFFSNLSEKTSLTSYVFLKEASEVPSLLVTVTATVISTLGVPRSLTRNVMLPANFLLDSCDPEKECEHKITLTTTHSHVPLNTLFSEYANEPTSQVSKSFALKNNTGAVGTILLAKSSERYRLQSNSLASLSLLVEQLIWRLRKCQGNRDDFRISFNPDLPVDELFEYVRRHFDCKKNVSLLQNDLSQLSAQQRLIQKRLISKFKSKDPATLKNLELLLNDTHSDIVEATEKLENEIGNLSNAQVRLSCVLHLVRQLLSLLDLDADLLGMINSTFCSEVYDIDTQAWEDVVDASLSYLLRTVLAKTEKDKLRAPHSSFEEVKDITKLQKHLAHVLERLPKQRATKRRDSLFEEEQSSTIDSAREEENIEKPIGSQFGESSSRLLSARKSLLNRRHKMIESVEN